MSILASGLFLLGRYLAISGRCGFHFPLQCSPSWPCFLPYPVSENTEFKEKNSDRLGISRSSPARTDLNHLALFPKLFGQNTFTTGLKILTRDSGRWNFVLVEKAFRCLVHLPNQSSEFCEGPNSNTAGLSGHAHHVHAHGLPPSFTQQSLSTCYVLGAGVQQ